MKISLKDAAFRLKFGELVAVPTETVYGLAAPLNQPDAIEKIFVLKGRPRENPLIIHLADCEELKQFGAIYPPGFKELASSFWPGPLTLILPIDEEKVPFIARAGLPTAGFRIPGSETCRQLIRLTGPLVMPSANLSGTPSSTSVSHVEHDFGSDFPVLEGEPCENGLESTILTFHEGRWVIARLGAISDESIEKVLKYNPDVFQKKDLQKPLCPGQLFRHYAPQAQLFFGSMERIDDFDYVLGFSERTYPIDVEVVFLGSLDDPERVAERLYAVLREIDERKIPKIWVDDEFPKFGIWKTIAERLSKAAFK